MKTSRSKESISYGRLGLEVMTDTAAASAQVRIR
jgi:hypothetical protein